jgi:hypothetical protein
LLIVDHLQAMFNSAQGAVGVNQVIRRALVDLTAFREG